MINREIILLDIEQKICKSIAKLRFNENRKNNIENKKVGDQDNEFTDLEGFGAEFAFCKLFNIFPDFSIQIRSSEIDNGDAILSNGLSVDVKTTKYLDGKLLAVSWKKNKIDVFALMVGEFPNYTFKGFMKGEELLRSERLGNLGHGKTYIASQNELGELDDLLKKGELINLTKTIDDFLINKNDIIKRINDWKELKLQYEEEENDFLLENAINEITKLEKFIL